MEPLKPQVITDFLPGIISSAPIAPIRFSRNPVAYSYYLHSIPSPKWFSSFFVDPFSSMISLKETPVSGSFLPLRFHFRSCHTSRNAFLRLSQSHPLFREYFTFVFLHKVFPKHPSLYYSLLTLWPILSVT